MGDKEGFKRLFGIDMLEDFEAAKAVTGDPVAAALLLNARQLKLMRNEIEQHRSSTRECLVGIVNVLKAKAKG